MKKYLFKYKWQIAIAFTVFIVIIPAIINWLFKINSPCGFLVAEWKAGDVLEFYGTMLASVATVFGVCLSIRYAQQNYRIDERNRIKPYFALTFYEVRLRPYLPYQFLQNPQNPVFDTMNDDNREEDYSCYEEYRRKEVYIIIKKSGIQFPNKLSKEQLNCLKHGGVKWRNLGKGNYNGEFCDLVYGSCEAKNVGNGAAIRTVVASYKKGEPFEGVHFYVVGKKESVHFYIFCDETTAVVDNDYVIELRYMDMLGNNYSQKYPFKLCKDAETGNISVKIALSGTQEIMETETENKTSE